jgi:hypothetical protein
VLVYLVHTMVSSWTISLHNKFLEGQTKVMRSIFTFWHGIILVLVLALLSMNRMGLGIQDSIQGWMLGGPKSLLKRTVAALCVSLFTSGASLFILPAIASAITTVIVLVIFLRVLDSNDVAAMMNMVCGSQKFRANTIVEAEAVATQTEAERETVATQTEAERETAASPMPTSARSTVRRLPPNSGSPHSTPEITSPISPRVTPARRPPAPVPWSEN